MLQVAPRTVRTAHRQNLFISWPSALLFLLIDWEALLIFIQLSFVVGPLLPTHYAKYGTTTIASSTCPEESHKPLGK